MDLYHGAVTGHFPADGRRRPAQAGRYGPTLSPALSPTNISTRSSKLSARAPLSAYVS